MTPFPDADIADTIAERREKERRALRSRREADRLAARSLWPERRSGIDRRSDPSPRRNPILTLD
jgi:hypothetical protein